MKTWKLVSGIICCVLFALVAFQSCAAGVVNTMEANGETSGFAGLLVAFLMLAGGVVSITTRKSVKNGGNIALIVLFLLAALIGFTSAGSFKDLNVWSFWCLVNAILAIISFIGNRKKV
ncbi:MAG: hypothetical protein ACI4WM_02475 [Erysipelotrichaceae bacterium]